LEGKISNFLEKPRGKLAEKTSLVRNWTSGINSSVIYLAKAAKEYRKARQVFTGAT
jgi:hypothetical protein